MKLWSITNLKVRQNTTWCEALASRVVNPAQVLSIPVVLRKPRSHKTWEFCAEGKARFDKEQKRWNGKRPREGLGRERRSVHSHGLWIRGRAENLAVRRVYVSMRETDMNVRWA